MTGPKARAAVAATGALAAVLLGITTNAVSNRLPPGLLDNEPLVWSLFAAATAACLGIAIWQLWLAPDEHAASRGLSNRRLQRQLMIQRQKAIWIDGALAHSLEAVSRIELGLASKPGAVQRPWTMVLRDTVPSTRVVNAGGPIGGVFDQAGGALLILGAPGGGKTTLLLELAAD